MTPWRSSLVELALSFLLGAVISGFLSARWAVRSEGISGEELRLDSIASVKEDAAFDFRQKADSAMVTSDSLIIVLEKLKFDDQRKKLDGISVDSLRRVILFRSMGNGR